MKQEQVDSVLESVRFLEAILRTINCVYLDRILEDPEAYDLVRNLLFGAEGDIRRLAEELDAIHLPMTEEEIRRGLRGEAQG